MCDEFDEMQTVWKMQNSHNRSAAATDKKKKNFVAATRNTEHQKLDKYEATTRKN